MRQIAYPYYLLALVATSVTVFFAMKKIDKHGFYHHYFRVIEDVELRNSQAVQTLPDLLAEMEAHALGLAPVVLGLLGLLGILSGLSLQVPLTGVTRALPSPIQLQPAVSWRITPTRAP